MYPYGLFLLLFQAQLNDPQSPSLLTTFSTVLPSIIKVNRYSVCILDLFNKAQDHFSIDLTLYRFPGLFNDYMQPNVIYDLAEALSMDNYMFKDLFDNVIM